ncbi:hypothetical protein CWT12_12375 [Actinomyces sp. 432]|uniref:hypothetical protein n=1 Tax=Actinomyces sp. 432 TaxID=2057798 RepID=UPI001373AEFC|nr:hypothetical protein [Actinomyces sp. 432]QHO91947.1 hypothetical protein CWT12_12375 [Actinomyces sp. 432]
MSSMVTIPTRVLTHPGIAACTSGALAAWLQCLLWAEEQCTDWYVPDVIVDMYADDLDAEQLVEHGLWRRERGGIRILPLYPITTPDTSEAGS